MPTRAIQVTRVRVITMLGSKSTYPFIQKTQFEIANNSTECVCDHDTIASNEVLLLSSVSYMLEIHATCVVNFKVLQCSIGIIMQLYEPE